MDQQKFDKFVKLTIAYEDFAKQDLVDNAVMRLLSENNPDKAAQVKRAYETLLKIASANPDLQQSDLTALANHDFKALTEEVIVGAGLIEKFHAVSHELASGNFGEMKARIAEVVQNNPTRQKLDHPTEVHENEIDFSADKTMQVIPKAVKFILPVPAFKDGGEPLVYPPSHKQAGQAILDYEKKPIGERGVVFENRKESVAAAPGDGTAVMIINDVTLAQAEKLDKKVKSYGEPDQLTLQQFKAVLTYARDDLGLSDTYNSSRVFVAENMSTVGKNLTPAYGTHKRDSRDVSQAVYLSGDVIFHGTSKAAGGIQRINNGAMIIKDPKGEVRAITAVKADATYMLADGKPLEHAFAVAEMTAALAQSHEEFGLKAGEVPYKNMDGQIVGVAMPSNVVIADGIDPASRKAIQGTGSYRELATKRDKSAGRDLE